jgi:hypothetical protein
MTREIYQDRWDPSGEEGGLPGLDEKKKGERPLPLPRVEEGRHSEKSVEIRTTS